MNENEISVGEKRLNNLRREFALEEDPLNIFDKNPEGYKVHNCSYCGKDFKDKSILKGM